jgi:hypothetical protein
MPKNGKEQKNRNVDKEQQMTTKKIGVLKNMLETSSTLS